MQTRPALLLVLVLALLLSLIVAFIFNKKDLF